MKNIVIIGGSSGIGLAVSQRLAGENIINISRTPSPVAGVTNIAADVNDISGLKRIFDKLGDIDALIYCAGASIAAPLEYTSREDIDRILNVNLTAAIECCRLALPKLSGSGGRILLLSSAGGVAPIAFDSVYSAAKAGLISLAWALRLENKNVKTTALIVPPTQTRFSFERKIYSDCGEYGENTKRAADALVKKEQTGYSADCIAKCAVAVLDRRDPPPAVTVGCKTKLLLGIYKLLPRRIKLWALRRTYNI